ncbi:MAG: hypothetical protein ACYCW6_26000 [Candidatus Xenobia bacterium]
MRNWLLVAAVLLMLHPVLARVAPLQAVEQAYQGHADRIDLLKAAGEQAYASGRYPLSAHLLARYCRVCISDWTAMMELCQAREAAGQPHQAQVVADRLQERWRLGVDPRLSAMDRFLRERIPSAEGEICIYEHFGPARMWDVQVTDPSGCPLAQYTVHTTSRGTWVRLTDLQDPLHNRTRRLPQRLPAYAAVRRSVASILSAPQTAELPGTQE